MRVTIPVATSVNICEETPGELKRVLLYGKFEDRLSILETTLPKVITYFMNLSTFVPSPESVPEMIKGDPFDNLFLAVASENGAHLIVSGVRHLLDLKTFRDIQIVSPGEAVRVVSNLMK